MKARIESILQKHPVKGSDAAPNLLSMSGYPNPGKWFMEERDYTLFLMELQNMVTQTPNTFSFVERFRSTYSEHPSRLALDIDSKAREWTEEDFLAIRECARYCFTGDMDTYDMVILDGCRDNDKVFVKYSYHVVFPNLVTSLQNMASFVEILKGRIDKELGGSVDCSIYTSGSLRMAYNNKKNDKRQFVLRMAYNADMDLEDGLWKDLSLGQSHNLVDLSVCLGPTVETPFIRGRAIQPMSLEPVRVTGRGTALINLERAFKATIKGEKRTRKGVQFRLEGTWCEIAKKEHSRTDGRSIHVCATVISYSCMNDKCQGHSLTFKKNKFEAERAEILGKENIPPSSMEDSVDEKASDGAPKPKRKKKESKFPILLAGLYKVAAELQYFRDASGQVYKELINDKGRTGYYQKVKSKEGDWMDMEKFVYEATDIKTRPVLYALRVNSPSFAKSAASEMLIAPSDDFPLIKKDKMYISFSNVQWSVGENLYTEHHAENAHTKVSCRYFDVELPGELMTYETVEQFMSIPTDTFDKVFLDQNVPPDALYNVYELLGQLFFWKTHNYYQIMPWIMGKPNTGKSTVSMCLDRFYDAEDVGTVGTSKGEFAIWGMESKMLIIATEVDKSTGMEQGVWQSMITGERLKVSVKHSKAKEIERWQVPMLFCSNVGPQFQNRGGAVTRRLGMIEFNEVLAVKDGNIFYELQKDATVAMIGFKLANVYLAMYAKYGRDDFWGRCHQYFLDTRDHLSTSLNPMEAFLASGEVVMNKSASVPKVVFIKRFTEWCKTNGMPTVLFKNSDELLTSFGNRNISICKKTTSVFSKGKWWPTGDENGRNYNGEFLNGVDMTSPS